jgi:hypothetical protein
MQGIGTADVYLTLTLAAIGVRRWLAALGAVVAVFSIGVGVSGCSTTSQTVSAPTPKSGGKAVCEDFNSYAGAISIPRTVEGDPPALLAKLVKAGASASNATLATEVKALGTASTSGLGANFGPAMANLKVTCQGLGFPAA